jgi:photosystem II stability/assembly factor-like uncharacterized protein
VASSADGSKLVAVEGNGTIAISVNSGASWFSPTNVGSSVNLDAVACSSDGVRMAAATGTAIYISADSGNTWTKENVNVTGGRLTAVASSADGSQVATAAGSSAAGNIFSTQNSGASWTQLPGAPVLLWTGIASSADGSQLVAVTSGGYIYVSANASTTTGMAGYLTGTQHTAIELEYVGNGIFLPLSHEGTIRAY